MTTTITPHHIGIAELPPRGVLYCPRGNKHMVMLIFTFPKQITAIL
ncbi:hypothetical protein ACQUJS_06850 [Ralstonia pseudosolanacearum]|uniref:Uncharacterized protein n=1 Tax=Ralstonia solanacearum TaxID=305 RepID=A0A0S4TYA1_RALSL|nr:protein of unknown function [Ralstonia solanacearum]